MQRGLDAETKKQLEEDEKRIISDEHWYLDLPELKAKEYVLITIYVDLRCPRLVTT
jgi:M-phase phosphoprotein-6